MDVRSINIIKLFGRKAFFISKQYLNRIIRTYASRGVRELPLRSLKGKTLAVDTSIYLYRYPFFFIEFVL